MSDQLRKLLWKQHDMVLVSPLDDWYKPLTVLKLSRRTLQTPVVQVWKKEPMAAFQVDEKHIEELKARVELKSPPQDLATTLQHHVKTEAGLRALFGSAAGHMEFKELEEMNVEFYSNGVPIGDLDEFFDDSVEPGNQWASLTSDSQGLLSTGQRTCAVIQEVFYAKSAKLKRSSQGGAGASVAAAGLGGHIGANAAIAGGSSQQMTVTTDDFHPFAFRFVLVSWGTAGWQIQANPSTRVKARGEEKATPWELDEPPTVERAQPQEETH